MSGQWIKTVCRICENGCGILVEVEDGIARQVAGDKSDPRTKGLLCPKGQAALSLVYSPERLKQPMMRIGKRGEGKWKPISWPEALRNIGSALQQGKGKYGAEAISLYRGQASDWGAPWHYALRFMNVLGSPNIGSPGHICAQSKTISDTATYGGVMIPDWENTQCIVLWGGNPEGANKHCVRGKKVEEAIKQGAKLIVIDPFKSFFAKKADLWLSLKPGTDCALALAMSQVIINENLIDEKFVNEWTVGFAQLKDHVSIYSPEKVSPVVGIPPEQIRAAARMYATYKPGIIYDGNGLNQHLNAVSAIQALSILRSITGNIDVFGGELFPTPVEKKFVTLIEKLPKGVKPVGNYPLFFQLARQVPSPAIIDAILNEIPYPIRVMLVQGGNPVVSLANTQRTIRAFQKLDFVAVMDLFLTRTAQYADIVLPASTFLETSGLTAFPGVRTNYLRLQQKAIEPIGETWPDWKFWFELGKAMGFGEEFPWKKVEEAINEQLLPSGYTMEAIKDNPVFLPWEEKKYLKNGFNTPSKKVELYASLFQKYNYEPLPECKNSPSYLTFQAHARKEYPLIGDSWPRAAYYMQTYCRNIPELRQFEPEPRIMINPSDAEKRKINTGDLVKVSSPNGEIKLRAYVTSDTLAGIVGFPWGWGEAVPEANMNDLVEDSIRDPICGATMNREFLCEVQPA